MKWEKYSLQEIANYWTGKIDASILNESNYVSTENLIPNKGGVIDSSYVPKGGNANSYSEKDVLISNIRPYFKKIWFADKDGGCSNDVLVFRAKEQVEPLYLYYQLSKDSFFDYMVSGSNGTKMPRGNKTSIMEFILQIPPLPTQRRIASILSAYDDLIENNLKRIKLLEEKAFLAYKLLNQDFPGCKVENKKLKDVLDFKYGKALKADNRSEGKYSVFGSSGVVGSHVTYIVKGPGIVVGRKGNVGSVFWSFDDFWVIDTAYFVESTISLYYLYFNLKEQHFVDTDAAVPGLNRNFALDNPIVLPPINEITQFEMKAKPIFQLMYTLHQQNAKLREARDILLPRLMSGEIEK